MALLRGDVERAAFATPPPDVEVRCSTAPTAAVRDAGGVDLTPRDAVAGTSTTERFELVGADGLRSTVRSLVFGPHVRYLERFGFTVAAFEHPGTPAGLAPGQGVTLLEPDRSLWVFAFADHDPIALLSWRTDDLVRRDFPVLAEEITAAVTAAVTADPDLARPSRLCPSVLRDAAAHPYVRAVRGNDQELLGGLTDDPRSARPLDALGPTR